MDWQLIRRTLLSCNQDPVKRDKIQYSNLLHFSFLTFSWLRRDNSLARYKKFIEGEEKTIYCMWLEKLVKKSVISRCLFLVITRSLFQSSIYLPVIIFYFLCLFSTLNIFMEEASNSLCLSKIMAKRIGIKMVRL